MFSYKKTNLKKPGLVPGTLIYTGKNIEEEFNFEYFKFTSKTFIEKENEGLDSLSISEKEKAVYWLNFIGLSNVDKIKEVATKLELDPLTIEDILNVNQRPKIEFYNNYLYLVLRMCFFNKNNIFQNEQISIIIKKNQIIIFQETKGDVFKPLRIRVKNPNSSLRKNGVDYLLYVILDIIIDNYLYVLEHSSEEIDRLDSMINKNNLDSKTTKEIYSLREHISKLRKQLMPVKEIIGSIQKVEGNFIKESSEKYFMDLFDHAIVVSESLEFYRESLSDLLSLYHTQINNKMNETMKVLTLIATIFIPLSFVVGIYGMNFDYMPELHWKYGYFIIWGLILVIGISMVYYFKKKNWI